MNPLLLLAKLQQYDIFLWVDGQRLCYSSPEGGFPTDLREELSYHKEEIIDLLESPLAAESCPASATEDHICRNGLFPVSLCQERLWFLEQLDPGNPTYIIPLSLRVFGPVQVELLERSIQALIQRHEILRTRIIFMHEQPVQKIETEADFQLIIHDLRHLSAPIAEVEARRLEYSEASRPFDLACCPLLRGTLLQLKSYNIILLTFHHIVFDGWSTSILLRELGQIYQAYLVDREPDLPTLSLQYADFAIWQRLHSLKGFFRPHLEYWQRQLAGQLPTLSIPLDKTRPAVSRNHGASIEKFFPPELKKKIESLANSESCTVFMVLLAAYMTLIGRHSGQEDAIIGVPIAGRQCPEFETLIGGFVNVLPFRCDLSHELTFRQLLCQVRGTTLDALDHQDLAFETLIQKLDVDRELSRTAVYQAMFVFQNYPPPRLELCGVEVQHYWANNDTAKTDISLYVEPHQLGLRFCLVYDADLFEQSHMSEFLGQFMILLQSISEDPDKDIHAYDLITPSARRVLPSPKADLMQKQATPVHCQFCETVIERSQNLAVLDAHDSWTYEELEQRSSLLACYLRYTGVLPGDIVGICMDRSARLALAMLGILRSGGVILPLDPIDPISRLKNHLTITKPKVIICSEGMSERFGFAELTRMAGIETLMADFLHDMEWVNHELEKQDLLELPLVGPDDPAHLLFTSGTSGDPKGVLSNHDPLGYFVSWYRRRFGLSAADRFAMLSGVGHDPIFRDVFAPLTIGAQVAVPPEEYIFSRELPAWIRDNRITVVNLTPTVANVLCTAAEQTTVTCPSLRLAFLSGESLSWPTVERLRALSPDITCVNFYGATETPQAKSYFILPSGQNKREHGDGLIRRQIPIGKGIPGSQLLIMTKSGVIAGIGETGEIYVRSAHLAVGYYGDESLSKDRFIVNTFTSLHGDRFYRTGDLGRFLQDGSVEFLGRRDRQVNIRGFRVELAEIEAELGDISGVKQCCVTSGCSFDACILTAYIVADESLSPLQLRRNLRNRIPHYMIPEQIVFVDELPMMATGKIEHRKLQAMPFLRRGPVSREPLQSAIEELMADIWKEVIGQVTVSRNDNFFDLGGSSMKAVEVVSRIKKKLSVQIRLRDILSMSLQEQAAYCECMMDGRQGSRDTL